MSDSEDAGEIRRLIQRRRRNLGIALVSVGVAATFTVALLLTTHVIEVVVEPVDADAELDRDRGALLTLGQRVFLYSDEGAVTVAAEGFEARQVAVARSAPERKLTVRLDPLPGIASLIVDSAEEFLVRVDGRIVGTEPQLDIELSPGTHTVTIEGPRIQRLRREIEIAGRGTTQTFSFSPTVAALPGAVDFKVAAQPSFARILIDGVFVGTGNYSGALAPGSHEIALEADGYALERRTIDVLAGMSVGDLGTITLTPLPAIVSIRSTPTGATVLVDGDFRGATPLQVEMPAGREHRISVRKTGFKHANEVLRPLPNARIDRTYDLARTSYQASVTANRPADIQVNGRTVGAAPLTIEVSDGDEITALAEGYRAQPIRVRPGEDSRRYSFKLLAPGQFAYEMAEPETTAAAGIRLRKFAPLRFDARATEQAPPMPIELSRPFYLAVHETTVAAFRAFKPNFAPNQGASLPVVSVTWQDAARYCNWLSGKASYPPAYEFEGAFAKLDPTSVGFRLPTEAEWEAVARYDFAQASVRGRPYAWGASPTIPRAFANLAGREVRTGGLPFLADHVDNHTGIAPVGTYPPNFNGIHDLAGNVSEWVNDYYRAGSFAPDARTDPLGPFTGTDHVVKGANHLSADRTALSPGYRSFVANKSEFVGFRVARWIH